MRRWTITTRKEEIEAELKKLETRKTALYEEWTAIVKAENEDLYTKLFKTGITLEKVMDLDWNRFGNGPNQKWYDKITGWLDVQQHGTYNPDTQKMEGPAPLRGVYRDGYNPETNQVSFKVMIDQNVDLDEQMGIKLVLPLIKPHEGRKVFQIFRHDCGESGNFWYLVVTDDAFEVWDSYNMRMLRHTQTKKDRARYSSEASFPNLKTVMSYIQQYHPYELKRDEDDVW